MGSPLRTHSTILPLTVAERLDAVCDPVQQRRARGNRQAAPFAGESLAGGSDGFIYLFASGFGNLGDYGTIGGVHIGELARAAHKMSVDIVLQELHGVVCSSERFGRDVMRG